MTKTCGKRALGPIGAVLIALAVAACGGGGGGGGTTTLPPPPPPNPGGGITGTGSAMAGSITPGPGGATITMNGVTMTTSSTTVVRIDDNPTGLDDVQPGMVGKVRGRINDDRVTGTAETIEIENEVRGPAANVDAAANPQTFTVNGQRVYVDSQTVYDNLANFGGISGGTYVEVHGFRDSTGAIRATRVEAQTPGGTIVDEIRGAITALGAGSFTLGSGPNAVTVTYTAATKFDPPGSTASGLAVGVLVEVHGNFSGGTFAATEIDFEDLEDSGLTPGLSENAEVEGIVSGFTGASAEFRVATRRVILSTAVPVRFEGGNAEDLANDVRVEAEGTLNASGVLVANKIQFKSATVRLQSVVSNVALGTPTNPGQFVVLGKTLVVTAVTRLDTSSDALSDIVNGDCVEVRARLDGTTLLADEVKELDAKDCDRWIVRGPVFAQDSVGGTVTLIAASGVNSTLVNVNSAQYRDDADNPISRAAFFAGASVGSIVKTRGNNPATSPLVATEAELEN